MDASLKKLQLPITDPPHIELHFLSAAGMEIPAYYQVTEVNSIDG